MSSGSSTSATAANPVPVTVTGGSASSGNGGSSVLSSDGAAGYGAVTGMPQLAIRAVVPVKAVGSIIGKSGTTIRTFREATGTKINISENTPGSIERILTLTGTVQGVAQAFILIASKLEEETQAAAAESSGGLGASAHQPGMINSTISTMRLLVSNSQVGSIIGKGGSKIKELQEQTGARITISEEPLPQSTERSLSISGTRAAVTTAVNDLCQKLFENPPKGPSIPYRPLTRPMGVPGPAGAPGGLPGPAHGAGGYMMPGSPAAAPGAGQYGHQPAPYGGHMYGAGAPGAAAPGYGAPPQQHGAAVTGQTTQQLYIPADMVGCIIGRGGSRIAEIRQRSGAQVKIEDPIPGSSERLVTVIGPPEGCQTAVYLIYHHLQTEGRR